MLEKPKILVVEDESIVAIDLSHTLVSLGYDVIDTAGTGEEALSIISQKRPDLVLMDIQLRGEMDGIQVAERIQNSLKIPVIYLSAFSDATTLSRARQTEPYGYIQKSFDHNDLHSTIEMALYKSKMERRIIEKERLLSATFKSIQEGVITTDKWGVIRLINASAERLFDISHEKKVGMKFHELMLVFLDYHTKEEVFPLAWLAGDMQAPQNEAGQDPCLAYVELKRARYFLKTKGYYFPVEVTTSLVGSEEEDNEGYVIVFRNIEEEHNYQAAQSRLVSIVSSSEDAIIGSLPDGTITSWNKGAEAIFGYTDEEVLNTNLSVLTPDFFPNEIPDVLDRIKNGENIDHYEAVRKTKAGDLLDMSIRISPIRDVGKKLTGVSIIARDITNRKALEKELLEIQDRERTRIGQDLHDSLGQHLTGILLKTKALENTVAKNGDGSYSEQIAHIRSLIKDAVSETRELAKGLIPVTVQSEGLSSAIKELCLYSQSMHGCRTEYTQIGDIQVDNTGVSIQLYHIAQEAINNAMKHANPELIEVTLRQESSELILSIRDDGAGMQMDHTEGIGLRIMQYRANMISAHLAIHSEKDSGTSVICRVPIKQATRGDLL